MKIEKWFPYISTWLLLACDHKNRDDDDDGEVKGVGFSLIQNALSSNQFIMRRRCTFITKNMPLVIIRKNVIILDQKRFFFSFCRVLLLLYIITLAWTLSLTRIRYSAIFIIIEKCVVDNLCASASSRRSIFLSPFAFFHNLKL